MNAASLTRPTVPSTVAWPNAQPAVRQQTCPAKPDKQLWETDEDKAFEAGVKWFLAVSRTA
jgi:hypothetical protein